MSRVKNFFRDATVKVGTKIGKKICDKMYDVLYGDDVFFDDDEVYTDPFAKIIIEYDRNDQIKAIRNIQTTAAAEELCWKIRRVLHAYSNAFDHYIDAALIYELIGRFDLVEKEKEYNKTHGIIRYFPVTRIREMRVKLDGDSYMIV